MKKERTISDAIKIVLKDKPEGMTVAQIYSKIIENRLYEFNAQNPLSVVTSTIRSSCVGVDNKFTTRVKEFIIVKEDGDNTYYALNSASYSEWWPTPEEYDPGFSVEDWLDLFKDKTVFTDDSMKILTRILEMGGEASCKELSEKYGEDSNYYNNGSSALAQRIHKKTKCPLMTRDDGGSSWWTVLYLGKNQEAGKKGEFVWKLREELKEALEMQNSKINSIRCWFVGAYSDKENTHQDEDFIQKGIWQNGYTDKFLDVVNSVKVGDKIAIKTSYVKKNGLPFDNNGRSISVMKIKIVGTVTANHNDGRTLDVDWDKSFIPKEWYFYTFRNTITLPKSSNWRTKALLDFVFNNQPQDYDRFLSDDAEKSNETKPTYLSEIIAALKYLGGTASLSEINNTILERDILPSIRTNSTWRNTVRSELQRHCRETKSYVEGNEELFYSVNGLGKGVWGLLDYDPDEEESETVNSDPLIEEYEPYTKQDFFNQVYMSKTQYDELKALLENKMNIILQGAPGVGKTYTAKRLAYSIMGEMDDSRIEFIQFHQNYSYEDFIMGYRPNEDGGFDLIEGVFYHFCVEKARKDSKRPYFFIIDEINRGNLSKIFGELLMLIEKDYRKESATLAYRKEKFNVPENIYIIGMMNTADRSLALIDYALRRRFSFFEIEPGFDSEGFKKYAEGLNNTKFKDLIEQIKKLNDEITSDKSLGKGFRIGHSYFCGRNAENCTIDWLRSVVKYDIMPTLEEYWFDDLDKVSKWETNLNGALYD